jgi:hypothetical protein
MPIIPTLGRLRQEDQKFTSLDYTLSLRPTWATQRKPYSKTNKQKHQKKKNFADFLHAYSVIIESGVLLCGCN